MLITTTSSIEGETIKEYRGIVFGEVINGVNFVKDFTAGITNFIGGRAEMYEEELINKNERYRNILQMYSNVIGE